MRTTTILYVSFLFPYIFLLFIFVSHCVSGELFVSQEKSTSGKEICSGFFVKLVCSSVLRPDIAMNNNFVVSTRTIFWLCIIICLCILCTGEEADDDSIAPMEEKEREALYSAIQGFVGTWWNGSDLYPDPCGWTPIQGVSCDLFNGFWYVTGIKIGSVYDNSLQCAPNTEFSHHIFHLNHLKALSFCNCFLWPNKNLVTVPLSNWDSLSNTLETLEFRSNPGLTGPIPSTFGNLKNLRSLVLLENGLTGQLPISLGNLVNLRRLVLAGNHLTGNIPASFGGLLNLLILDSSRNSLSGTLPSTVGDLSSLLKLDLSSNVLEGVLPRDIGQLKNVTLLDLGSNKFSGGLPQSIQEMVSLEELVLSNNPIGRDLMNIQWGNLKELQFLDLSDMDLTGEIPTSMIKMKKLRFLGLRNNNISGNVPPMLEAMPSISTLYLNSNNFTGKLKFSKWFYGKMGSRLRASENENLCFPVELMDAGHVPIRGVKLCQTSNL